jgi:hypothetical protein
MNAHIHRSKGDTVKIIDASKMPIGYCRTCATHNHSESERTAQNECCGFCIPWAYAPRDKDMALYTATEFRKHSDAGHSVRPPRGRLPKSFT